MGEYQPASRRPIAEPLRHTARFATGRCVKWGVHPDVISYLSVVAAAGAGVGFAFSGRWRWLLVVAPLFCVLRLWCNMLDGMVALAGGKASLRGEIVNELPDRVSDVLIFAGVAHSGWVNPFLGYWAAILALLTAYVGTLAQAVTGRRRFEGVMSKQYRMLALVVGSVVTLIFGGGGRPTWMEWTCWVIVAGCVQTIVVRLVRTMRDLRTRAEGGGA
jgi:phosphatidylglycerophosphate synthase